jgi:CubicO group peptidase (beta-lactamase class C family)
VTRRITGQRLGEFFAAHIGGPLGADFHTGLPPSEFHRVANVVPPPFPSNPPQFDTNSVWFKTMTNPTMSAETTWTEGWRRAYFGADNSLGYARWVALLQSAVACGGEVDGVRLLSPQTIDRLKAAFHEIRRGPGARGSRPPAISNGLGLPRSMRSR